MPNKGCAKQGVCHTVALPFALKGILQQKKNYGNSNISPSKNIIFKISSKRNQIFQDIPTLQLISNFNTSQNTIFQTLISLATTTPTVQSFGVYKIAAFKSNQHQEAEIPTLVSLMGTLSISNKNLWQILFSVSVGMPLMDPKQVLRAAGIVFPWYTPGITGILL